jgi:hypothetical protein
MRLRNLAVRISCKHSGVVRAVRGHFDEHLPAFTVDVEINGTDFIATSVTCHHMPRERALCVGTECTISQYEATTPMWLLAWHSVVENERDGVETTTSDKPTLSEVFFLVGQLLGMCRYHAVSLNPLHGLLWSIIRINSFTL